MAIKVWRANSRIPVKISGAVFMLSPLTQEQKISLMQHVSLDGGNKVENIAKMAFLSVKYSLKEVTGLKFEDDSEYVLEHDSDGLISDKSVSELMNSEITSELLASCQSLMQGIPKQILDPKTGKKFENVEILPIDSIKKK